MDDDQIISELEQIRDELTALRDRLFAADDYRQETEETGDAEESQFAKQELAAARFAASEAMGRYKEVLELIRKKRQ